MNAEDLIETERAGRRCSVCHSGRGWRRFEVVRPAGSEPVVLCGSCRARFGDDPPIGRKPSATAEPAQPLGPRKPAGTQRRSQAHPDRLQAAVRKLPGSFSTATAARAAGLNKAKALARLQELERRGEVYRVGNRWSTQPSRTELDSAMDRLAARTSNLRIVRERARAG